MQREYFCGGCGLFHWVDMYETDKKTGRIDRIPYEGCPNEECISHKEEDVVIFSVDSTGFAYFCESNREFIDDIKWSSPKYAHEKAINIYKRQGIPIKE